MSGSGTDPKVCSWRILAIPHRAGGRRSADVRNRREGWKADLGVDNN